MKGRRGGFALFRPLSTAAAIKKLRCNSRVRARTKRDTRATILISLSFFHHPYIPALCAIFFLAAVVHSAAFEIA